MAKKSSFRQIAYSSVCIISLLSSTAQAFTADEYFAAASNGDYNQMRSFIEQSRAAMAQSGGSYDLNLDIRDANGNTAAMDAAANGHLNVVNYLVNYGANLELKNNQGQTAYSLAMQNGHMDIAEYILNTFQQQAEVAPAFAEPAPNLLPPAPTPAAPTPASATALGINYPLLGTIALGAVAGAGLAFAAAGGGGGGGGGSTGPTDEVVQDNFPDTGGTSGAGSIDPAAGTPSTFLTSESDGNEGYAGMRTQFAAAKGYDGSVYHRDPTTGLLTNDVADGSITVAVLDTGVDITHTDLDTNIDTANAVTCTIGAGCVAGGTDSDATEGHGTKVAGIIAAKKDGVGVQGIAPAAKIMPIAFLAETDGLGAANGSDISGIAYATAHDASIINASYALVDPSPPHDEIPVVAATQGSSAAALSASDFRTLMTTTENGKTYEDVFTDMVNNHGVIVYAAGNASMDQVGVLAGLPHFFQGADPGTISGYATINPNNLDFSKNWVTVVSLQDDLTTISTFSNECGVAKDWCLAAPGELDTTVKNGGGYETNDAFNQGTSFAAPNVSGALAVLMGAFPHLSAEQLLKILFDTATDLGAVGVDDVYGHGLVNLEKAVDPTAGGWNIVTGPTSFSSSFAFNSTSLRLGTSFGDGLKNLSAQRLIFLDAYQKDYTIALGSLIKLDSSKRDPLDTMQGFGESKLPELSDVGGVKVGANYYASSNADSVEARKYAGEKRLDSLMLATDLPVLGRVMHATFAEGVNVADVEKIGSKTSLAENSMSGSFRNQYMGLSENSQDYSIGSGNEKLGVKMGYYTSNGKTDEFDTINNAEMRGFYSSVNYKPSDSGTFFMQSGVNIENGSFLGSQSSGALSLSPETKTYYNTLAYEHSFTDNLTVLGSYSLGMTDLGMQQDSLVTNVSNAMSDSFALGMEYSGVLRDDGNDKFGIAFSQPLRVRNASADVRLPVDVLPGGDMVYNSYHTSIAPEGRELDLEGYYSSNLDEDTKLMLGTILRSQPDNIKDAQTEALFMTKYSTKF